MTFALLGSGLLLGCAYDPSRYVDERGDYVGPYYQQRSSVFTPPALSRVVKYNEAKNHGSLPWYAVRKDFLPFTTFGYETARVESSYTTTYEYLYQNGGQVRDYQYIRNYSSSNKQVVR